MKKFRYNLLVHILPIMLMIALLAFAMMMINRKF